LKISFDRQACQFADYLRKREDPEAKTLMGKTINAAVYETHGNPADVLRVESRPWPTPAVGEAVVKMRAAPINPADLNQIEGKYPIRTELPATPGFEGAGLVVDVGADVSGVTTGTLVILPHNVGTWRDAVAVKADQLVSVPAEIEPVHAAMLKINPMTAWCLLHDYVDLKKGDWLIQNAANSAAGRAVIQIAHELGYKTVNVVRRAELIDELRTEGGDIVLVDGENLRDEVKAAMTGATIRLGLNAVGGQSALRLANCLAPGSTLVTYGAMSLQPLKIPNGLLIFKDLRFRGIWINKWYDNATLQERMDAFRSLFEMAKRGLLKTKVDKAYPLMEAIAAVTHAAQGKRSGKIIFEFE
jgi:trans-2-enoyl-CoA reductase